MTTVILKVDFETDSPTYGSVGADSEELAAKGRRVMVCRDHNKNQFSIFVAPKDEMSVGWVLGVETTNKEEQLSHTTSQANRT